MDGRMTVTVEVIVKHHPSKRVRSFVTRAVRGPYDWPGELSGMLMAVEDTAKDLAATLKDRVKKAEGA